MSPYYQADGITLYCGDCMDIAPQLGDRFDCVITDPPYGETSLEWDMWPKGWPEIAASLSNSLWCFGSMRMFLDQRDEFKAWKFAQDVVWEKHNGSGLQADRFRRVHENAIHFYTGEWAEIHKQPVLIPASSRRPEILRRGSKPQHFGGIEQGTGYERGRPRIMRSVIAVNSCHGFAVNETQKPEGIVAPLMSYSVSAGGSLIDLFAGSGTMLVVARQQGKRAVGIEKRESQCEEIVRRLSQRELITT